MSNLTIEGIVEKLVKSNLTTYEYYREDGSFTSSRKVLHKKICKDHLSNKNAIEPKKVFLLGGAPGTGKSTFLSLKTQIYPVDAVKINLDDFRLFLPEYELMIKKKELLAANIVHEECSYLTKLVVKKAIEKELTIIWDKVSNEDFDKREEEAYNFRDEGYRIRMDYVTCDTKLCLKNNRARAKVTGREVPEETIKKTSRNIALIFPDILENEIYNELYLWDMNEKGKIKLILKQQNGILEVKDNVLYNKFKAKCNE